MLVTELKSDHFKPLNLAFIDRPEPRAFALDLQLALQQAGMNGQFIPLPSELGPTAPNSSSGAMMLVANPDGERLGMMLWQKFEIGGGGGGGYIDSHDARLTGSDPQGYKLPPDYREWVGARARQRPERGRD
jgi:hypothetical protein